MLNLERVPLQPTCHTNESHTTIYYSEQYGVPNISVHGALMLNLSLAAYNITHKFVYSHDLKLFYLARLLNSLRQVSWADVVANPCVHSKVSQIPKFSLWERSSPSTLQVKTEYAGLCNKSLTSVPNAIKAGVFTLCTSMFMTKYDIINFAIDPFAMPDTNNTVDDSVNANPARNTGYLSICTMCPKQLSF